MRLPLRDILFPFNDWKEDPLDDILPEAQDTPNQVAPDEDTVEIPQEPSQELSDRDEWELYHKHIFDDLERYYYYCEFVDGYVGVHGLRGIKERNAQFLKELRESDNRDRDMELVWKLVENNRPLAKREAMRAYSFSRWTDEDLRDAYGDAILLLAQRYIRKIDELKTYSITQLQYLNFYTFRWACTNYNINLKRRMDAGLWECEPLDEESPDIVRERILNVDVDELVRLAEIFNKRNRYILLTYIFGDHQKNILSYFHNQNTVEDIGWNVDLTRARVNQIINKMFRILRRSFRQSNLMERLFYADEQYHFEMEKKENYKIQ